MESEIVVLILAAFNLYYFYLLKKKLILATYDVDKLCRATMTRLVLAFFHGLQLVADWVEDVAEILEARAARVLPLFGLQS